jgi:hypothetical protein
MKNEHTRAARDAIVAEAESLPLSDTTAALRHALETVRSA